MNIHSRLMRFFLVLGQEKLAWACRRLYCPVPKSALVLEVGSGGSPYLRANVLIDAYADTRERHWAPFITDRPSALGMGEALPFKDKVFDFVIASHVLEHSSDPKQFLLELQRVARAGYIETPDALMERINPYWDHRSEVTIRNGCLRIKKKAGWMADPEVVELYEARAKPYIAGKVIPSNPFLFHTRFYWKDSISFEILNPDVSSDWPAPDIRSTTKVGMSLRARLGRLGLAVARALFSQTKRNKSINLLDLLQCPICRSTRLRASHDKVSCERCGKDYEIVANVPRMYRQSDGESEQNAI